MTEPAFLTAEWRHLAMAQYEVRPALVERWVPRGTDLDAWNGKTLVSLVGFRFLGTRVRGIPVPFHRDFDEVNLRLYVRRKAAEGWRRGVVFVKEIVPRRAIAWVARRFYNENYVALPMRHRLDVPAVGGCGSVCYAWRHRGRWDRLRLGIEGEPHLPDEGSEESFLAERAWGYAAQPDGSCLEYRVEHPRWRLWPAREIGVDCSAAALYGDPFAVLETRAPASAFVAEGSAVVVRRGRRMN